MQVSVTVELRAASFSTLLSDVCVVHVDVGHEIKLLCINH